MWGRRLLAEDRVPARSLALGSQPLNATAVSYTSDPQKRTARAKPTVLLARVVMTDHRREGIGRIDRLDVG